MVTAFQKSLSKNDLAENTITSYVWTVNHFLMNYKEINTENLLAYKGFLIEREFDVRKVDKNKENSGKISNFKALKTKCIH